MVDRPIKKSELQKRAQTEGPTENDKGRNQKARKDGRGKGRDHKDKKKPAVPMALMRGPKPSAKVEDPEPVEGPEEVATAGEDTEAAEATDAIAEATEADSNAESTDTDDSEASEANPTPEN